MTYYRENDMLPKNFGPHFWYVLHAAAFEYPLTPSPREKEAMYNFVRYFYISLPCESCKHHRQRYIDRRFKTNHVSSRGQLFRFFVDMHNNVSARLDLQELSVEQAYNIYKTQ